LGVSAGTSTSTPPVASWRQVRAKFITSARWVGVSVPRRVPISTTILRLPSWMAIGWRSR